MAEIICYGSLNIDYVYSVDHFVRPGETLISKSRAVFAGGKGGNQSIALAKAGAKVRHAGKIGKDGLFLKETLEKAGVDCSLITIDPAEPTGHAIIQIDPHGENTIIVAGGANQAITAAEIDRVIAAAQPGDYILLQNEISNTDLVMQKAKAAGLKLAMNFAPFDAEDAKRLPLKSLDILIVNEHEGYGLTGVKDFMEIMKALRQNYPDTVTVMTIGPKGVLANLDGKVVHFPSPDVKVVDTTSAGDTFIGYLMAGVLGGMPFADSLKYASCAAAITVSRPGAAESIPYKKEVDQFIKG